jgi:threonylcarbamoyladenosine tRNA methylthiotransferase MtaB
MRRPYSPEYYADLVRCIRSRIEDASIGADVMVGFPGETDADFAETFRLIEESSLTYLHIFPYSSRPGTVAADMQNKVPSHVANFRAKALRQLIARKHAAFLAQIMNELVDVLVLNTGEGLTSNFIRVRVPESFPVNQWARMRLTHATV